MYNYNKKLHPNRFYNSSSSDIKRFAYVFLGDLMKKLTEKYNINESRIVKKKDTFLLDIDLCNLRLDLQNQLPKKLSNILQVYDLRSENRKLLILFKKLTCTRFLSKKFFSFIKESLQIDQRKISSNDYSHEYFNAYISDEGMQWIVEQDKFNKSYLYKKFSHLDDIENRIDDIRKSKESNVYMQIRAIEDIAIERNYDFLFITIKPCSDFHMYSSAKEIQKFFSNLFKLHRNFLYRHNLNYDVLKNGFGFKACEPHKNGNPHYHLVICCDKKLTEQYIRSYNEYFMRKGSNIHIIKNTCQHLKFPDQKNTISNTSRYCFKNFFSKSKVEHAKKHRIISWRKYHKLKAYSFHGIRGKITLWNEIKKISVNNSKKITKKSATNLIVKVKLNLNLNLNLISFKYFIINSNNLKVSYKKKLNSYGEVLYYKNGIEYTPPS